MAQRSILSMFKKSNDRLGNPVKDKIRLGQPESVKIRSESRTGNPTLADNNRLGQPENYAENQSESRGQPEITFCFMLTWSMCYLCFFYIYMFCFLSCSYALKLKINKMYPCRRRMCWASTWHRGEHYNR